MLKVKLVAISMLESMELVWIRILGVLRKMNRIMRRRMTVICRMEVIRKMRRRSLIMIILRMMIRVNLCREFHNQTVWHKMMI